MTEDGLIVSQPHHPDSTRKSDQLDDQAVEWITRENDHTMSRSQSPILVDPPPLAPSPTLPPRLETLSELAAKIREGSGNADEGLLVQYNDWTRWIDGLTHQTFRQLSYCQEIRPFMGVYAFEPLIDETNGKIQALAQVVACPRPHGLLLSHL